jgi:hypothetical protein
VYTNFQSNGKPKPKIPKLNIRHESEISSLKFAYFKHFTEFSWVLFPFYPTKADRSHQNRGFIRQRLASMIFARFSTGVPNIFQWLIPRYVYCYVYVFVVKFNVSIWIWPSLNDFLNIR